MTITLLEAARLLKCASQDSRDHGELEMAKGNNLPGWLWMESKNGPGGFNAVTFKKGQTIVVAIKGQLDNRQVDGWARIRAHLVDLWESVRRQFFPWPYVYPTVGIDYVREIQLLYPNFNIIVIGHSAGGGWGSDIAYQLGLKALAFGSGAKALRTNEYANNPETVSVEIEDDPWGNSQHSNKQFLPQRHPLETPIGHWPPPSWKPHLIDAYIAALEKEEARAGTL